MGKKFYSFRTNGDGGVNSKRELNEISSEDVNRTEMAGDLVREWVC
jgi:hypothetical protein